MTQAADTSPDALTPDARPQRNASRVPLALRAYAGLTTALAPMAPWVLRRRARAGKEDARRLGERLGAPSAPRPPGPLTWMHGASVGEALMLLRLARALLDEAPDLHLLMTTGTVTSARLMAKRLPAQARHQFAPVDTPGAAQRFMAHWRPDLAIFAESELWPNVIRAAERSGARLALVNARMNARSLESWRKRGGAARWLLGAFDAIGAADAQTAQGLGAILGAPPPLLGNLKFAAGAPPGNDAAQTSLQQEWGPRRLIWLAASTHPGEDALMLEAHAKVRERHGDALLLLAPRHPERGPELQAQSADAGFATVRRAAAEAVDHRTAVYVVDTLGEMGLWLRLAQAAVIAGSFVEHVGGHTPLEAAWTRTPLITGPHVRSFTDVYAALDGADAVLWAEDAEGLAQALLSLDGDRAAAQAEAGYTVATRGQDVLAAYMEMLRPLAPRPAATLAPDAAPNDASQDARDKTLENVPDSVSEDVSASEPDHAPRA